MRSCAFALGAAAGAELWPHPLITTAAPQSVAAVQTLVPVRSIEAILRGSRGRGQGVGRVQLAGLLTRARVYGVCTAIGSASIVLFLTADKIPKENAGRPAPSRGATGPHRRSRAQPAAGDTGPPAHAACADVPRARGARRRVRGYG